MGTIKAGSLPAKCWILVFLAGAILSVNAEVYKCETSNGTTSYSDRPCSPSDGRIPAGETAVEPLDRTGARSNAKRKGRQTTTDLEPPALLIETPTNGSVVDTSSGLPARLAGTASDAGGDVEVTASAGGDDATVPVVNGKWSFPLSPPTAGWHEVTVTARDEAGNETTATVGFNAVVPDPNAVLVHPAVIQVEGALLSALRSYDEATGVLVFAREGLPEIRIGAVLVCAECDGCFSPVGFARKVTGTEVSGGTVVVQSDRPSLTDIFLQLPGLGGAEVEVCD